MKFLVISTAPILARKGSWYAYSPYVKEMNIWFRNVQEPAIASPIEYPYSLLTDKFISQDLKVYSLPFLFFSGIRSSVRSILLIPLAIAELLKAFFWADHIHLRCPGNIGLIGCILQIFFPSKPKTAKYAGNWDHGSEQPWSYKLQRWLLSNSFLTRNIDVLVYGHWSGQSRNIKSFFTASFSEEEKTFVEKRSFEQNKYLFLFVGSLVQGKHPAKVIRIVEELNQLGFSVSLEIYGNGPEKDRLKAYCQTRNLQALVSFKGNRPLSELKEVYQKAHFLVLPSETEGWPKVVAEAMFFGCIPIATPVSCVPWMLGHGNRGILLEENQRTAKRGGCKEERRKKFSDQEKILALLKDPEEMKKKSKAAKKWSQQYTLEKFEAAIAGILDHYDKP